MTSYTKQTFSLWIFWVQCSGQWHKARRGPVERYSHCITVTDCIYSIGNKCASAAPCHAPFPQSSSKPWLWAVFPGNFKASLPLTVPGKGPATSQHDRGLLALIHPLSHTYVRSLLFPWGKHKLDITACKKVIFILWQMLPVQSYFRWVLSSVVIHNISSFIQEQHKRLEATSTKKCFSLGELAVIFLMCLLAA